MNPHILNSKQKIILRQIGFLKPRGFYLAGGTALALQFGHRTSKDLDFYASKHFDSQKIIQKFQNIFPKDITNVRKSEDTLRLQIKGVELSFFTYPYPLISPLLNFESVKLAGSEDIAAMKMEAILGRGAKRDFIDIYYLFKKYGLGDILKFTEKKYSRIMNEITYLNALLYFKDAEAQKQGRKRIYLYGNVDWQNVKTFITEEVKKYQLTIFKKK